MRRAEMLACGLLVLIVIIVITGCGGTGEKKSIFDDPSCVNSPHGSVPPGSKAYSPDGTRYAQELEPINWGNIGIFNKSNNQLISQFRVLSILGDVNDLKAMAWSRSSEYLAIMYHGGPEPGINLYNARNGELTRFIGLSISHYMVFSNDNKLIITTDEQFPSGLEPAGVH